MEAKVQVDPGPTRSLHGPLLGGAAPNVPVPDAVRGFPLAAAAAKRLRLILFSVGASCRNTRTSLSNTDSIFPVLAQIISRLGLLALSRHVVLFISTGSDTDLICEDNDLLDFGD